MFDSNEGYNCEESLKRWAKALYVIAIVIMVLCGVIGFFVLLLSPSALGLIVIVSGIGAGITSMVGAHLLWGFGDIVGTINKIYKKTKSNDAISEDELPKL